MGKGLGVLGNARKRIGNTVFYALKNSNNNQTQGIRTYQPVVTNPKTDGQSAQRIKLMPLQIFYESFSDVLDHAFEGRRVGQMNRQRFMQLNMKKSAGEAPAIQKGERILAPIRAQVSSGSLPIDTTVVADPRVEMSVAFNNLSVGELSLSADTTVADFSKAILDNNLGFEDGFELAFIAVVSNDENPRIGVPMKFFVVLNVTDNITTLGDCMGNVSNFLILGNNTNGVLTMTSEGGSETTLLGAALIVSKKRNGGWSNTNSKFVPTLAGVRLFYTDELYQRALATYGPDGFTLESNLFLRQANNETEDRLYKDVVSIHYRDITLVGDYEGGTLSRSQAAIASLRSGERRLVVNAAGQILGAEGVGITITRTVDGQQISEPLKPAMTTFSNDDTIVYTDFPTRVG